MLFCFVKSTSLRTFQLWVCSKSESVAHTGTRRELYEYTNKHIHKYTHTQKHIYTTYTEPEKKLYKNQIKLITIILFSFNDRLFSQFKSFFCFFLLFCLFLSILFCIWEHIWRNWIRLFSKSWTSVDSNFKKIIFFPTLPRSSAKWKKFFSNSFTHILSI